MVKRTVREFGDDGGTDLAAALTYYSVLAIFPGLLALLSLVGVVGQAEESVDKILEILRPLLSSGAIETIREPLNDLATSRAPASRWSSACSARCGRPRATSARSAGR